MDRRVQDTAEDPRVLASTPRSCFQMRACWIADPAGSLSCRFSRRSACDKMPGANVTRFARVSDESVRVTFRLYGLGRHLGHEHESDTPLVRQYRAGTTVEEALHDLGIRHEAEVSVHGRVVSAERRLEPAEPDPGSIAGKLSFWAGLISDGTHSAGSSGSACRRRRDRRALIRAPPRGRDAARGRRRTRR